MTTLLGITYDIKEIQVAVKEERNEDRIQLIKEFLKSDRMTPGQATKLKGKLRFAGCHCVCVGGRSGDASSDHCLRDSRVDRSGWL